MANIVTRAWDSLFGATSNAGSPAPVAYSGEGSSAESRSLENPAVQLSDMTSWGDLVGYMPTRSHAGVVVTPESAMRVSAVYACINAIAETVAMLPIGVYKETAEGRELDKKDPLQQLFIYGLDDLINNFDFMYVWVANCLAHGNSYAWIERDRYMKPIGIRLLEPGECVPMYVNIGRTRYLYYTVYGEIVERRDILHIRNLGSNGVIGKSPIELHAEGIGLSIAAEQFGARFYGNGTNTGGALEMPAGKSFKTYAQLENLRKQFSDQQSGLTNSHKPIILEDGMTYKPITIPQNHAQFIETRAFQVEDIARIYRVPQHKIGKLDRSTNNNIEHQNKEFITDVILPWTERIRQELERKLIAEDDKGLKEVVFDFDFLLRGDSVAEAAKIQSLFNTGSITQNEIRRRNNLNRLPGHDDTFVQTNMGRVLPGSHMGEPTATPTDKSEPKPNAQKTDPKTPTAA